MTIPKEVKNIIEKLQENGFEAYAVGGCVRDLLLGKKPKDWDVATNARPEQIQAIFPDSFYENKYGTVGVKVQKSKIPSARAQSESKNQNDADFIEHSRQGRNNSKIKIGNIEKEEIEIVEVTTYRVDEKYTDKRHPDEVRFTGKLEEDLARRDFSINAMALSFSSAQATGGGGTAHASPVRDLRSGRRSSLKPAAVQNDTYKIIDYFGGQEDLANGVIRAVDNPEERFNEDALRLMRAVRLAVELSFTIEAATAQAIKKNAQGLQAIAKERINDELTKIIMSDRPDEGILMLSDLGLLLYIIPELAKGVGVAQNRHHIYTIFEHNILSLKFAAEKKYNLVVRLAALLHDIAKPQTKRGEGEDATFYNHQIAGARAARQILERLRYSREIIDRVDNLVYNHMFVYDIGAVTEAGVRRLLARVGPENMQDLLAVRIADRLGSGVPKAQPYRLRHFQYMVAKVQHDAISVKMLKINGSDLMKTLQIEPGPKIGAILDVLLAEVIEDPEKNKKENLQKRAKELDKLDLVEIRKLAKARIAEERTAEDKEIKKRYWVE